MPIFNQALIIFNKDKTRLTIPRKNTDDYNEVMRMLYVSLLRFLLLWFLCTFIVWRGVVTVYCIIFVCECNVIVQFCDVGEMFDYYYNVKFTYVVIMWWNLSIKIVYTFLINMRIVIFITFIWRIMLVIIIVLLFCFQCIMSFVLLIYEFTLSFPCVYL